MKTLTLDQLVKKPATMKHLTSKGESVQVTELGKPLWVVHPAPLETNSGGDEGRPDEAWWEAYFVELDSEPRREGKSAAQILIESRGNR